MSPSTWIMFTRELFLQGISTMTNKQFCNWSTLCLWITETSRFSKFQGVVFHLGLWLNEGHSDCLFYQHRPSGTVRGVTLLSATDWLSSTVQILLSEHIKHTYTQNLTPKYRNTTTQASTHTSHILIGSLLSVRERGLTSEVWWVMRQQKEEQKRRT